MIRPYLVDMINKHKNKDEWKIKFLIMLKLVLCVPKVIT